MVSLDTGDRGVAGGRRDCEGTRTRRPYLLPLMRASVAIGRVRIARQAGGISNPAPYHSIAGMRSVLSSGWRRPLGMCLPVGSWLLSSRPRLSSVPRRRTTRSSACSPYDTKFSRLMRSWAGYRYSLDRNHLRRPGLTSVMTLSII